MQFKETGEGVITQGGLNMGEVERIGKFIYFYQEDTVVIAYMAQSFQDEACKMIEEKLEGIAEKTGEYYEVVYNGDTYMGIAFNTVSELQLIVALTR
jgi:hypothetical protein